MVLPKVLAGIPVPAMSLAVLFSAMAIAAPAVESCASPAGAVATEPFEGIVSFRVTVMGTGQLMLRVCIQDEGGVKIHDHSESITGPMTWEHRVALPLGSYQTATSASTPEGWTVTGGHQVEFQACVSRTMVLPATVNSGPGMSVSAPYCDATRGAEGVPPNQVEGSSDPAAPVRPFFGAGSSRSGFQWPLVLGSILGVGTFAWPRSRYFVLGLFSRVSGPAVLDQETRREIYELVRQDPGINAHRVEKTLALGSGETRYHLLVLRRNRLISEVRRGSLRFYFVAAIASPEQLRATAVLRNSAAERLYEAVLAHPGANASTLARAASLRPSQTSKALHKLVEARLVERVEDGREVRVRATNVRPLTPPLDPGTPAAA